MTLDCQIQERTLTVTLGGELDHHRARQVMEELDRQIDRALPRQLRLDLGPLAFTDSSGIAVLIRLCRRMGQLQGTLTVTGTPQQAMKVFRAAGLERLIRFEP